MKATPLFSTTAAALLLALIFTHSITTGSNTMVKGSTIAGVNYSPFHSSDYPSNGGHPNKLKSIIDKDFNQIKQYFRTIKTFYSSFYGQDVASIASKHGLKLYMGIYMTNEAWGNEQIQIAIQSAKEYPRTVKAIIVGNENINVNGVGPYAVSDVIQIIQYVRDALNTKATRHIKIGTAQRINEWLVDSSEISALANACDLIGVNMYPFFSTGWSYSNPVGVLTLQWNQMLRKYPSHKLRLTETGFPSSGKAPLGFPSNTPSRARAFTFYKAFMRWNPKLGGGEKFYFKFFDLHPVDQSQYPSYEEHFGLKTYAGRWKFPMWPVKKKEHRTSRGMK